MPLVAYFHDDFMERVSYIVLCIIVSISLVLFFGTFAELPSRPVVSITKRVSPLPSTATPSPEKLPYFESPPPFNTPRVPAVVGPFIYSFNSTGILNEVGSMERSSSPYWWLSAGGEIVMHDNIGETMQGEAPLSSRWRNAYALSNPRDTDGGTHPQNIFRLVSKYQWNNADVSARFYIARDNPSTSPNRNKSNGLFLFTRYVDAQTVYYTGIRVDGTAVIKKKINGVYYTMAQKQTFSGTYAINATSASGSPSYNLLPHHEWIGLKNTTRTNLDGSVTITLAMQRAGGAWQTIAQATDRTNPIKGAHHAGIRTDFMDVQFDDFRAQEM